MGIGLLALVFYLWIIHSYKLAAGDVAVLGIGAGVLLRGRKIIFPVHMMIFGLFIAWGYVGLLVTESAAVTNDTLLAILKVWLIALGIINLVRTAAELRFVIIVWLALYALYPVRGAFYNHFVCQCTIWGRVTWNFIFSNPNDLAALTFLPLGLAAGVAYVERVRLWRLAAGLGVAVLGLLIMLTQSRGAMLALGVAVFLLLWSSRRRARDIFLFVVAMGGAALLAPKGVWERLAGLAEASVDSGMQGVDPEGSAASRWQIWSIAAVTIRDNPLLGVGAGAMPDVHAREAALRNAGPAVAGPRDTHSTYLRIAAEMGIPGLALYLVMWGVVMNHVRTVRRRLRGPRPAESQALLFMELALWAYSVAAVFGSYGWLAFTHVGLSVAWLAATILDQEPWFVPQGARARVPINPGRAPRGAVTQ